MREFESIILQLGLNPDKTINFYRYGSVVYKTENINSDNDFIIVYDQLESKKDIIKNNLQATVYSRDEFKKLIIEHEISVLECLFLPFGYKCEREYFPFKLDKKQLRVAISSKASNSFVKAKKKLDQGDIYIGQKSLFHSLRILLFGIQIAKFGKINDFTYNFDILLKNIMKYDDWKNLKEKYKPIYNTYHSLFKTLTYK